MHCVQVLAVCRWCHMEIVGSTLPPVFLKCPLLLTLLVPHSYPPLNLPSAAGLCPSPRGLPGPLRRRHLTETVSGRSGAPCTSALCPQATAQLERDVSPFIRGNIRNRQHAKPFSRCSEPSPAARCSPRAADSPVRSRRAAEQSPRLTLRRAAAAAARLTWPRERPISRGLGRSRGISAEQRGQRGASAA